MPRELKDFKALPLPEVIRESYRVRGQVIGYVKAGNPKGIPVLFIHGSPGGWDDFKLILGDPVARNKYCMVSVDRPGWGGSAGQGLVLDLKRESRLLRPALSVCGGKSRVLLVGHSLGGCLAARMAYDHKDLVAGLVMISTPLDPDLDPDRWYNRLGEWLPLKHLFSPDLAKANQEILALEGMQRKLARVLSLLSVPVIVVQGAKDHLVDPENFTFAKQIIGNRVAEEFWLPEAGHFIPQQHPQVLLRVLRLITQFAKEHDSFRKPGIKGKPSHLRG